MCAPLVRLCDSHSNGAGRFEDAPLDRWLPAFAPDSLRFDRNVRHCPSCDLARGPVADVINLVTQCDGDLSQLALIHPNPSAALVDLFGLAQRERLALTNALNEQALKEAENKRNQPRRRR